MNYSNLKRYRTLLLAALLAASLTACGSAEAQTATQSETQASQETVKPEESAPKEESTEIENTTSELPNTGTAQKEPSANTGSGTDQTEDAAGGMEADEWFTNRDLTQEADLSGAETPALSSGKDLEITTAGVYVLSGNVSDMTVIVNASSSDKVQLVLDGLSITNEDFPCIYVKCADKVFVTTTDSENSLTVTGSFTADGTTNTDAAIFSKDGLVLNGVGSLSISSTDNGITSKDELKVTGGTLTIECSSDALEANDAIAISDGAFQITAGKDGLNAGNDETTGTVFISGGTFQINSGSDGIQGDAVVQIDDGTFSIKSAEGIEGTFIQINGGVIEIEASDDGINAALKSSSVSSAIEINGGEISITMGAGDTDALDSNGNVYVNGGTLDISAQSPFDYDGTAEYNGGTIYVNGNETDAITNQMMGGFGGMGKGQMGQAPSGNMGNGQADQFSADDRLDTYYGYRQPPSAENGGQWEQAPYDGSGQGQMTQPPSGDMGSGQMGQPPTDGTGRGQMGHPPSGGMGQGQMGQPPAGGRNSGGHSPDSANGSGQQEDLSGVIA